MLLVTFPMTAPLIIFGAVYHITHKMATWYEGGEEKTFGNEYLLPSSLLPSAVGVRKILVMSSSY
jgi:hypothetical protein